MVKDGVFSEVAAEIQFKSCLHNVSGADVLTVSPLPEDQSGEGRKKVGCLERDFYATDSRKAGILELPRHFVFVIGEVVEIDVGVDLIGLRIEESFFQAAVERLKTIKFAPA